MCGLVGSGGTVMVVVVTASWDAGELGSDRELPETGLSTAIATERIGLGR